MLISEAGRQGGEHDLGPSRMALACTWGLLQVTASLARVHLRAHEESNPFKAKGEAKIRRRP